MKPGRNDPCPCGSGEKYKKCCGRQTVEAPPAARDSLPDAQQLAVWMKNARYSEVESASRRLLASEPSSGVLWKLHASALLAQRRDALGALGRAADLLPDDAELQLHLGHELLDRGESRAALDCFRRLLERRPRLPDAHDSLGVALLADGEPRQAAESHRRALALNPRLAEAHGNLGNALVELGEHAGAVEHYRAMLEQRPAVAEAHNNLGNALLALRRYEEAAASYREALTLRPDAPGALLNLGGALREAGRPLEALGPCQRALELRPEADGFKLLGHIQSDLGELDRAVESYRRSLALDGASEETLLGLGKTLRRMGRTDAAEEACRKALAIAPIAGDGLTLLAELQADRGRFDEANALLRQAIDASPDQPEAWAALAQYRRMDEGDPQWHASVQRVLAGSVSPAQEINLRYALGKFFDDQQRFAEAFDSVRRANELQRRAGPPFDRARLQATVERIRGRYDAAWMKAHLGPATPAQRAVFIVGMPRSGTSLIEQILASHPAVFGAGELRYWNFAAARIDTRAHGADGGPDLPEALSRDYLGLLQNLSPAAERVVDKMPANFMHLGLIRAALPGARIIHVRRHPLDVVLSIYFQAFSGTHAYSHDLEDIVFYYRQYRALMQHWHDVLGPGAILNVDYESLVHEPERWSRRLIEHVGLPWDARCLEFHQTSRVVSTASNWQVRQALNTRGIDRWRHYESQLQPFTALMEGPDA